jgi:hypothetical protein
MTSHRDTETRSQKKGGMARQPMLFLYVFGFFFLRGSVTLWRRLILN